MTIYEKPKLVDLSAMEWETGAGQVCNPGSAGQAPGCENQGGCTGQVPTDCGTTTNTNEGGDCPDTGSSGACGTTD